MKERGYTWGTIERKANNREEETCPHARYVWVALVRNLVWTVNNISVEVVNLDIKLLMNHLLVF
jgi:hypothetical protein